jgi:hypothetical protein
LREGGGGGGDQGGCDEQLFFHRRVVAGNGREVQTWTVFSRRERGLCALPKID